MNLIVDVVERHPDYITMRADLPDLQERMAALRDQIVALQLGYDETVREMEMWRKRAIIWEDAMEGYTCSDH